MMFSTKAEYGVRVMVELARRASDAGDGDPVIPLAEIAEHDGMPLAYLEHLVARLRKAGLLDSRRGSRGGYMLARPAGEITMAEVVEALEGSIAPIECISRSADGSITCSAESKRPGSGRAGSGSHFCPTKVLWTKVRASIVTTLLETTLADLLVSPREAARERTSATPAAASAEVTSAAANARPPAVTSRTAAAKPSPGPAKPSRTADRRMQTVV